MNTVLVTGGLGFVGTNIIAFFHTHTSYHIRVFDRPLPHKRLRRHPVMQLGQRVTFFPGDLLDRKSIDTAIAGSEYVVHLAARTHARESLTDPISVYETNVLGTAYVLEHARNHGIKRFIQFSSCEVYGNHIRGRTMDESHPLNPVTPYAASKAAGDRLAASYWESYRFPVVIVRPFNMYGLYQTPDKMIPLFIQRLTAGQKITLFNAGRSRRDFIHVQDVADAVYRLIRAPARDVCGEVFNIGTGKAMTVRSIAKQLVTILHKHPSLLVSKEHAVTETMNNVGVSKKIARVLRWKPSTSVSDGLNKTVAWYLRHQEWLNQLTDPVDQRP